MFWRVRAFLPDRPGAMAALAAQCGDQDVNILGLQIFPTTDGVIDELVLHTPSGWASLEVEHLLTRSGARDLQVCECTAHALEDTAVSYARAAHAVIERPETLEDHLCRLLDASPGQGLPGLESLAVDDGDGPPITLQRSWPFTDTELARAVALSQVAHAITRGPAPTSLLHADASAPAMVRTGSLDDTDLLVAMHARCSADTIHRRYHAPMPYLTRHRARILMQPEDGWSAVATSGDELVGFALLTDDGNGGGAVGLLVEDRWQRRGVGSRLLHALAMRAADQGLTSLSCIMQPDSNAGLATIRRAGLRPHVTWVDGLMQATMSTRRLAGRPRQHESRAFMGRLTTPLVALLHERQELREIYPAADSIDQAIREGA